MGKPKTPIVADAVLLPHALPKTEPLHRLVYSWVFGPIRMVCNFGPAVHLRGSKAGFVWKRVHCSCDNVAYWNRHEHRDDVVGRALFYDARVAVEEQILLRHGHGFCV